jgi:hypothetical protein
MRIRFAEDMPVASVEVLSPDLATLEQFAVQPGTEKQVEVPSESSFIRVHLPSGRIVTLRHPGNLYYLVSRSELEGKLNRSLTTRRAPKSMHEVERYHEFRSVAARAAALPDTVFGFNPPMVDTQAAAPVLPDGIVATWIPPLAGHLSLDERELAFSPENRLEPYTLRVKLDSTVLVVRFPGNLNAAYVRVDELGSAGRVVGVRVATRGKIADTIGAYLARSDYYAAETMVPAAEKMVPWAEQAEGMLMGKIYDPYSATVAAYLLLRLERFDLMRDWARNLANWFPFLADGCVIWAWQNIRERENYAEAEEYLLKAAERGLPLHTEGLRLLSEGLRQIGKAGEAALAKLTKGVGRVLWNSPFTAQLEGTPDPAAVPTTCDVGYIPAA